jgi:hypothetical protein
MALHLVFKGPLKAAKRAASRSDFPVKKCKRLSSNEVVCDAPCSAFRKVSRAYKRISIKSGRGAAPGDLLLFNYGTCERGELSGARRRRRRKTRR